MDYTSLVLSQCRDISFKISEVRVMKGHCRQLGQKLTSVEKMVLTLQSSGSITPQVGGALQTLYTTLMSADSLLHKCAVNRVVNKGTYKNEFNILDRQIQDSLRVLATIPHVNLVPSTNMAPPTSQAPSFGFAPSIGFAPYPGHAPYISHAPSIGHTPYPSHAPIMGHAPYPGHAPNHASSNSHAPSPIIIDESINQYNFTHTYK
ncbi:hypothetical protein NL108_012370 [Boleophthalmus pectinirostris]|nr:hypothetical protein NL108_012370 [Boleophthalmus pectinirostris]